MITNEILDKIIIPKDVKRLDSINCVILTSKTTNQQLIFIFDNGFLTINRYNPDAANMYDFNCTLEKNIQIISLKYLQEIINKYLT